MTSMPLTERSGAVTAGFSVFCGATAAPAGRRGRGPAALLLRLHGAVTRRDALLLGVRIRDAPDHRPQDLHVRLVDLGIHVPGLAVPGHDLRTVDAHVVHAARGDRVHEALEAELLDPRLVDVQVLEAPADLLARHRLVAVAAHRLPDRFDRERVADHDAVVVDLTYCLARAAGLAIVEDGGEVLLMDLALAAGGEQGQGAAALGAITGRYHVGFPARVPDAEELFARESGR